LIGVATGLVWFILNRFKTFLIYPFYNRVVIFRSLDFIMLIPK